ALRIACTPSRCVSKQSHSSPVIVTANSSASGNRPTSPARAAGSRSGCFQRANGTDTARLSAVAAFRFAPPTSSPKIVGGIVPRKIQGPPMPRYLVGIDLGTTNSALAYVDTASKPAAGGPKLHTFNVPQVVAAGQVGEQPLLPSFLYLPGPHDLAPGSIDDVDRNLTAEAAQQAGLKHVTLLEEPQPAFYAWLGTPSPQEAGKLKPGVRGLVVDVGGGTSDFSLIRAGEGHGELTF